MNKYHNQKCYFGGVKFDSKKESNRYSELLILEKAGEIKNLERQKRFLIIPKSKTERAAYYVADFVYQNKDGAKVIEDVKSYITKKNPAYILKRKLIKNLYPDYNFIES